MCLDDMKVEVKLSWDRMELLGRGAAKEGERGMGEEAILT